MMSNIDRLRGFIALAMLAAEKQGKDEAALGAAAQVAFGVGIQCRDLH